MTDFSTLPNQEEPINDAFPHNERNAGLIRICSSVSFIMLALYFADIILLGTGNLTKIGPLSTRILFFGLAILFSLPLLWQNLKYLIRQKFVLLVVLFLCCVGVGMLRGIWNGNASNILKSDVSGYLNFCLLPTMLCVLNTKKRKKMLMAVIVGTCALMAVAAVALTYARFLPFFGKLYGFMIDSGICALTLMSANATRVVFHTASRVFFVAFCIVLVWLYHAESKKKIAWGIGLLTLFIMAIYLSYTRAFYAGWAIATVVFFLVLLLRRDKKLLRMIGYVCVALLCVALLVGLLGATQHANLYKTALFRLGITFEASDGIEDEGASSGGDVGANAPTQNITYEAELEGNNVRKIKIDLLTQSIRKNPIFGHGLGAAIDYDDGYVEYVYYDIVNKMGAVGLICFLLPFGLMSYCVFYRKKCLDGKPLGIAEVAAYAVMVYFLFITYFNPCMNTTLGIAHYLLCLTLFSGDRLALPAGKADSKPPVEVS